MNNELTGSRAMRSKGNSKTYIFSLVAISIFFLLPELFPLLDPWLSSIEYLVVFIFNGPPFFDLEVTLSRFLSGAFEFILILLAFILSIIVVLKIVFLGSALDIVNGAFSLLSTKPDTVGIEVDDLDTALEKKIRRVKSKDRCPGTGLKAPQYVSKRERRITQLVVAIGVVVMLVILSIFPFLHWWTNRYPW
jgi:hypothetical protein